MICRLVRLGFREADVWEWSPRKVRLLLEVGEAEAAIDRASDLRRLLDVVFAGHYWQGAGKDGVEYLKQLRKGLEKSAGWDESKPTDGLQSLLKATARNSTKGASEQRRPNNPAGNSGDQ